MFPAIFGGEPKGGKKEGVRLSQRVGRNIIYCRAERERESCHEREEGGEIALI